MSNSNYDKFPFVEVEKENRSCVVGWEKIGALLRERTVRAKKTVIVVECYPGVDEAEILSGLKGLPFVLTVHARLAFREESLIREMVAPDVTDDRVFGYLTRLKIMDYLDAEKVCGLRENITEIIEGIVLVYGTGASCIAPEDALLVYADLARWEIQLRMRRKQPEWLRLWLLGLELAEQRLRLLLNDIFKLSDHHVQYHRRL